MAMPKNGKQFFFLLLVVASIEASQFQFDKVKQTNIVFYMQNWETGVNISAIPVVGAPGLRLNPRNFGTIVVIDDDLTIAYDRNSTQIGTARGIYVNSALEGTDLQLLLTLVFTCNELNGSTLEIKGSNRFLQKHREVSVLSGTGKFRMAKGYAILETAYYSVPNSNVIIKWNVTVFHF